MTLEQQKKETKPNFFTKLKNKWNVKNNFEVILILLTFSITGSLSIYVAKPVLHFFNINKETLNVWAYYPLRILIIFPCYQVLLMIVGTLLGQFRFFWEFQKRTLGRMVGYKPTKNS